MDLCTEQQFGSTLRAQASRDNDQDISERVCEEIKQSVIFQHNWQNLLQSVPVAISATGAAYAASFSDAGKRVTLNLPPSGSFQYLEYESLSANLLTIGDKGRAAFMKAEGGLMFVKDVSTRAENKVALCSRCGIKKLANVHRLWISSTVSPMMTPGRPRDCSSAKWHS
jgi:hypothetical protein